MPDYRHSATACVELTIEIEVGSSWGGDCSVAQVHKQAEDEARDKLHRMISEAKGYGNVRLIGHPKVTAILATREQSR